jgi:hypothetical protein
MHLCNEGIHVDIYIWCTVAGIYLEKEKAVFTIFLYLHKHLQETRDLF